MNKSKISIFKVRVIIVLMSLALIGLIGLQYYWISGALKANKLRFEQSVFEALTAVAQRLEQREMVSQTQKAIYSYMAEVTRQTGGVTDFFFQWEKDILHGKVNENGDYRFNKTPRIDFSKNSQRKSVRVIDGDQMVTFVLKMLADTPPNIEKRLNFVHLDSIVRIEMHNKGVNTICEYGVFDRSSYRLHFSRPTDDRQRVFDSNFSVKLFQNDLWNNEYYLKAYFPEQESYLFGQMWIVLMSSALFISIIIFCFITAIYMIIKQKKISEVIYDFINNMTHEFKTPLTSISLACEMLQDSSVKQSETANSRYLRIIKDEGERLKLQVEKVLEIARLDRSEIQLKLDDLDINELIEDAIQHVILQVEIRNGVIETEFMTKQHLIRADTAHLMSVIINLLDNANKYSPNPPRIHIKTEKVRRGIKIHISDQGQGIGKLDIDRIFDKFYRISTGNIHNVKGFGLGLSYVQRIVEAHRGTVNVRSELNKGSKFTIFLPTDPEDIKPYSL
ncbi:MAG: sensor histidine kinase [Cytophagales bacterium]|nr:MAG: sensor histidine kinase [Cytophagales bacterium]TAF61483.1 MAG: sensor histidine kinase [Cytophagales bacterium]